MRAILLLTVFLLACENKIAEKNARADSSKADNIKAKNPDTLLVFSRGDTIPALSGDLENTLQMYAAKDSFRLFYGDHVVEIFSLNGKRFGVILDSMLRVYTEKDKCFHLDFALEYENSFGAPGLAAEYPLKKWDVNFDGFEYLVIEVATYGAHGNVVYSCLLFDPQAKKLKNKTSDLENISLDPERKLVRSKHYSSIAGASGKMLYRFASDTAELVEEIWFLGSGATPGNPPDSNMVEQKKILKGVPVETTIVLPSDAAWDRFARSLWDSRKTWLD